MNTFKKQIIASAVALGFAGAAQAATSVTLYGIVDVGYGNESTTTSTGAGQTWANTLGVGVPTAWAPAFHPAVTHGTGASLTPARPDITVPASISPSLGAPSSTTTNTHVLQNDGYHDGSRLGVKGQEDLGNGLSAIFKAEMRFGADTGTLSGQLAESYVGLKGSFGEVTVGRRENITSVMFGYDSAAKELNSLVGANWNNALSYRGAFGGLTVGADVTTGEANSAYSNSSNPGYKVIGGRDQQYAAGIEYNFGAGAVGVGYEHAAVGKNAYVLGLKYKVGPVEMFGRVSRARQIVNNFDLTTLNPNLDKTTTATSWAIGLNYTITPNDVLGLSYSQLNANTNSSVYASFIRATSPYAVTNVRDRTRALSMDYTHSLSKRTSVYLGMTFQRTRTRADSQFYNALHVTSGAWEVPSYTSSRSNSYNIGLKHSF